LILLKKADSSGHLKYFRVLNDESILVEKTKVRCKDRSMLVIGFQVLEYSKELIYSFFYEKLSLVFPPKTIKCSYFDTDGGIMLVYNLENWREYFKDPRLKECMDFSNLPESDELYSKENSGRLGLWSFEKGAIYERGVCLRAKTLVLVKKDETPDLSMNYIFDDTDPNKVIILAKGIPRSKIYKEVRLQNFIKAYFGTQEEEKLVYRSIRFEKGELVTRVIHRIPLHAFDDKRRIESNSHETLPFGHIKHRGQKRILNN
jgi:hypothetical protein